MNVQWLRTGCLLALTLWSTAGAEMVDNEHLRYEPPAGFAVLDPSRMSSSVTYSFNGEQGADGVRPRLQISIVQLPAWSREAAGADPIGSLDDCLELFLQEIGREQQGFDVQRASNDQLAGRPARSTRWIGRAGKVYQTGILQCAREGNRYFVIHMQDALRTAPENFQLIKASLDSLQLR